MIITPVENFDGLYYLKDVYDTNLIDLFLQEDFNKIKNISMDLQEHMTKRESRTDFPDDSNWNELIKSYDHNFFYNLGFLYCHSTFWLDKKDFEMSSHIDNDQVIAAMQVYLTDGEKECGTTFIKDGIEFTVPYKKNHGYFMINTKIQHGVLQKIPHDRYSIYNHFKKFKGFQNV